MEPKTKIITNPIGGSDVINYRISEAVIDPNTGDVIIDRSTGNPQSTTRTFEWSLKVGQTLRFPAYVADYLLKIYPFLKEVKNPTKDTLVDKATYLEGDKPIIR